MISLPVRVLVHVHVVVLVRTKHPRVSAGCRVDVQMEVDAVLKPVQLGRAVRRPDEDARLGFRRFWFAIFPVLLSNSIIVIAVVCCRRLFAVLVQLGVEKVQQTPPGDDFRVRVVDHGTGDAHVLAADALGAGGEGDDLKWEEILMIFFSLEKWSKFP